MGVRRVGEYTLRMKHCTHAMGQRCERETKNDHRGNYERRFALL